MTALRCSRVGLSEMEILEALNITPARWARVFFALEDLLVRHVPCPRLSSTVPVSQFVSWPTKLCFLPCPNVVPCARLHF